MCDQQVWHREECYTQDDGTIRGTASTNDNEDWGYPSEYADWPTYYRNIQHFAQRHGTGSPYRGCMGAECTVLLDGEHWKGKEDPRCRTI